MSEAAMVMMSGAVLAWKASWMELAQSSVRMVYSEDIPVSDGLLLSPGERFLRFWLLSGCGSPFYLEEGRVAT